MMAFPSLLLIGQNASILIFAIITIFLIRTSKSAILSLKKSLQLFAFLFAISAIFSVINIPALAAANAFDRAISVLPNYLYWSFLIIFLIQHRGLIYMDVVFQAIFWGVVGTVIYYLFLQNYLVSFPIFNRQSPNGFAFIMICYTPIAVHYLKKQKNSAWALTFLVLMVFILLKEGRRAGMVLVLLGGIAVLYAEKINWKTILLFISLFPITISTFQSSSVKKIILQSNERIYGLIYDTEKIRTKDLSYLTRVAMIKKGLAIFKAHPYTGIGLNNFTNYTTDFEKSFEGAKYVINKKNIQATSAHNSYISILAEGGVFLFIPFVLLIFSNIYYFLINYNKNSSFLPVYVGLIGLSVHFYFISAVVNVFAWFLIGLASVCTYNNRSTYNR